MEQIPVDVILDGDSTPHRVVVDQRDFAKAEAMGLFSDSPQRVTRTRYLAWSAAHRAGVTKLPWPKFNDEQLVHAEVAPEYEAPADDSAEPDLDPGRSDQTAGG